MPICKQKRRLKEVLPVWMTNIHSMFYYYLFLITLGILFMSTSLFINYFTTPFTGDYSSQQFAFYTNGYDDWWHFIKTGEFVLYDTNTFLGADNIGSNSFYYLFDPFFLPILLVPRQLVPQGMAILTVFKMSACGMIFFAYMRYMGASRRAAKITGIAYAFSGWITWYLWFNHFTEMAIVFPLILFGVEKVLKEKKPLMLMAGLCLMGFVNFFFLVCFSMCAFLYAMFRYFQRLKLNTWKDNLIIISIGFVAFAIGILMPMMVVLPAAMHSLTSPRATNANYLEYLKEAFEEHNFKNIIKLLTNWTAISNNDVDKARVLYPFIEFIFPVTSCRGTPLTVYGNETYDNVAGSFYCFIPMLILLYPAFKNSLKNKRFSVLIPLAFFAFALFTPFFYYMFHGFTVAYSRWTLFVVTSIMTYTGLYLDKLKDETIVPIFEGMASLLLLMIGACIAATFITTKYSENFTERVPIWLAGLLEGVYIIIFVVVLSIIKTKKKIAFYWVFTGFLVTEITLMGGFVVQGHGVEDYYYTNKGFIKNDALHALVKQITKDDNSYYRSYSSLGSSTASNDSMRNNYNGMNFFHSIYNYNTADICNWSSITNGTAPGSWSGNYVQKRINLDTLLGVKYYYVEDDYYLYQGRKDGTSEDFRYNVPLNYVDITDQYPNSQFRVYKNADYIDFALTYDTVYPVNGNPSKTDQYDGLYDFGKSVLLNEEKYLQAAIINEYRDETVIPDILENHPDITVKETPHDYMTTYYSHISTVGYTTQSYSAEAMITYYDMTTNGKNSLECKAEEYLNLSPTNPDYKKYPSADSKETYRKWVAVIECKNECFSNYDPAGNTYYLTASYAKQNEYDIYFVDTNNQFVTFDNHNDGYHTSGRSGKNQRGFYIAPKYEVNSDGEITIVENAPKIKKIIIVSRNSIMANYFQVYVDTATKHNAKMNKLKEHVVTDVKSGTNKWSFKTNFDKEKIVVTRLAYEEGFSLKMTDAYGNKKDVKVFNGQGGFVSFISGTGECAYELQFYTPYLKLGSLISSLSTFVFFSTMIAYMYIDLRRENKQLLGSWRNK